MRKTWLFLVTILLVFASCTSKWENPQVEKLTNGKYLITLEKGERTWSYFGQGDKWLTYPGGQPIGGCSCQMAKLQAIANSYEIRLEVENHLIPELKERRNPQGEKTKLETQHE